jgi:ABC-type transport system substrate-binding protein
MDQLKTLRYFTVVLALVAITACSGPLPTATPVPAQVPAPTETPAGPIRAIATALPTSTERPPATPLPTPQATPTPASGFFRDAEQGFWLNFPDDWSVETTGQGLPAVFLSDPDDPVSAIAGASMVESGLDLEEMSASLVDQLGLAEKVSVDAGEPAALDDGTPALALTITWQDEDGVDMMGQGLAAEANGKGFIVLLYGRPEVIEARPQTVKSIAGSLHLEQPELFGVSRQNALVLAMPEPRTLDPALTHEAAAGIVGHVFSGLVRLNPELSLDGDIAENWDVTPDGLVYTFHLRQEAQFHDGRAISAADVQESWERAADPELGSPTAAYVLGDIADLEVVDSQTLQVTIDSPKPYFLYKLTQPSSFVIDGQNLDLGSQWWRQPNGSGPFKLRSWRPGSVIVLERHEGYQPAAPAIESVIYYLGESGLPAYEADQVDATQVEPWNLARAQDPADSASADLQSGHRLCTWQIILDTSGAPFDDVDMRKAFALAVDRQSLAADVLQGAAVPAYTILPPGMPGYVEPPDGPALDLGQATSLLSASNYVEADLEGLTMVAAGVGSPNPLITALVDQWRESLGAGIEVELIDPQAFPDEVQQRPANMVHVERCADYPDPEAMLDPQYHSDGYANIGHYASDEVDDLLERARTETDGEQRLELYQQAEALILSDAPSIQLVHPSDNILVRPYIQNFRTSAIEVVWPAYVSMDRESAS